MQRQCKSNAEYQACLNIMLRCSLSYAKISYIFHFYKDFDTIFQMFGVYSPYRFFINAIILRSFAEGPFLPCKAMSRYTLQSSERDLRSSAGMSIYHYPFSSSQQVTTIKILLENIRNLAFLADNVSTVVTFQKPHASRNGLRSKYINRVSSFTSKSVKQLKPHFS